jgi:hypothetical protein
VPARTGQRPTICTEDILEAVATRGRRWTAAFADEEITVVNEALDRELLQGNLVDAVTLSAQGERVLADHRRLPTGRPSGRPSGRPRV